MPPFSLSPFPSYPSSHFHRLYALHYEGHPVTFHTKNEQEVTPPNKRECYPCKLDDGMKKSDTMTINRGLANEICNH